jgi:hypothetical protein
VHRLLAPIALMGLLAACTLNSDPASDSVGRASRSAAAAAPATRTLGEPVEDAPVLRFHAPAAPEFDQVEIPKGLKAGVANLELTTEGQHNVAIAGPDIPEALVLGEPAGAPADKLTASVELSTGTYTYYCSVPGHRGAGMVGTFTVA